MRLYSFGFITYIVQVTTSQVLVKFSDIYRRVYNEVSIGFINF